MLSLNCCTQLFTPCALSASGKKGWNTKVENSLLVSNFPNRSSFAVIIIFTICCFSLLLVCCNNSFPRFLRNCETPLRLAQRVESFVASQPVTHVISDREKKDILSLFFPSAAWQHLNIAIFVITLSFDVHSRGNWDDGVVIINRVKFFQFSRYVEHE